MHQLTVVLIAALALLQVLPLQARLCRTLCSADCTPAALSLAYSEACCASTTRSAFVDEGHTGCTLGRTLTDTDRQASDECCQLLDDEPAALEVLPTQADLLDTVPNAIALLCLPAPLSNLRQQSQSGHPPDCLPAPLLAQLASVRLQL